MQDLKLFEGYKNKQGEIKSCVVYGDTKPYKDKLMEMGGKFNPGLMIDGEKVAGYIFGLSKLDSIKAFLSGEEVSTRVYQRIDEIPFATDGPLLLIPNVEGNELEGRFFHPLKSPHNVLVAQVKESLEFMVNGIKYRIERI